MSERSLLADAVATFFGEQCAGEVVEHIEAGADARPLWNDTEELGLTLASVPEEAGGGGGTLVDGLTVLRSAGRQAVPLPLAETGLLAGWALAEAGLQVPEGMIAVAPVRREDRVTITVDGDTAVLEGRALRVPWAAAADHLVVVAEDADGALHTALIAPSDAAIEPGLSIAHEPRDTVVLSGVRVAAGAFAPLPATIDELQLRGALSRSVQMLGAMEKALEISVQFAKDRAQFGRPIAKFQAVQHMLAGIAREVAVSRSAVELAATAASENGVTEAWLEIAAAKVVTGRAAGLVSAPAHQVHGAMGVTKEYHLSILTRRMWSWRDEFGRESYWAQRIGAAAFASDGGVWDLVSSGRVPLDLARTA